MSSHLPVMSTYQPKDPVSILQGLLRVNITSCTSDGDMFKEKEKFNSGIVI